MSLRSRLFLAFGGLLALLVCAQWWLVRTLSQDLRGESGAMALSLGSSVLTVLGAHPSEPEPGDPPQGTPTRSRRLETFVVRRSSMQPLEPEVWSSTAVEARELPPLEELQGRIEVVLGVGDGNLSIERRWTGAPSEGLPEALSAGAPSSLLALFTGTGFTGTLREDPDPPLAPSSPPHALEELAGATGRAFPHPVPPPFVQQWCPEPLPGGSVVLAPTDPTRAHTSVDRIPIPSQGIDTALESFSSRLLAGSGAILALGLVLAGLFAHRVSSPLRALARAAHDLGAGALGRTIPERGDPEVSRTIGAFNAMSVHLARLDAEARLLREREHLGELGEVGRAFAHTLRNPLHVLGLTLDALAASRDEDESARLQASGRAQIRRVDQAVRSFLALASGDAASGEDVRLHETAQDVALELLQSGAGEVHIEVSGARELMLPGVAAELRAVLQALVVNAVEASPPGATVEVRVEATALGARVRVADRGTGLAPAVRERLFTPHLTTKEHGAGMGLYLARRIATARYGGSLELLDREGGGTLAVLELGARREDERAA